VILQQTYRLIRKDFAIELRQRHALGGILLYVLSTVFITYLAFEKIIEPATWNALFWVILLFACVNAVSKSFVQESHARLIYYYTIADPRAVILSKMIYNTALTFAIGLICSGCYMLLYGSMVIHIGLFFGTLFLGCVGLSGMLTLSSGIASRSGGNFTMTAILSFPISVPLLITLIRLSSISLTAEPAFEAWSYLAILAVLNIIIFMLAYVLFPYIWKE